jgi:HEPN domain-containing protein
MTRQTEQWVRKAEGDWDAVLLLRRSRKQNRYDIIGFHCQQCAEKYLKARLLEAGISFPKTHDLEAHLILAAPIEPAWQKMQSALSALTDAAVEYRYPGQWSDSAGARRAFSTCERFRVAARKSLGLRTQ